MKPDHLKILFLAVVLFCTSDFLLGQDKKPCADPTHRQFDFWVGEWDLEWKDQEGKTLTGHNSVSKIMNGCAIEENFNGNPGMQFRGKSLSVFNSRKGRWLQTWVDNQGAYLDFSGEFKDGKMMLSREVETEQGTINQRMTFYNISKEELDWDWEVSRDGGETWRLAWRIHYTRSK